MLYFVLVPRNTRLIASDNEISPFVSLLIDMYIDSIKSKSPYKKYVLLFLAYTINMTPFVKCLLFTTFCLMIGDSFGSNSLDKKRTNFTKRADRDSYYNIYTKINAMEKDLKNLETKLQKRTKLLRHVLQSVLEMDSKSGSSDKSLNKENILSSKENGIFSFHKSRFI